MKQQFYSTHVQRRILAVTVIAPENRLIDADAYSAEFRELVESSGVDEYIEHEVRLRTIDNATYFTRGKLEELVALCHEKKIEEVIISEPLVPQQVRNLSDLFSAEVKDRTDLILDIFEYGAQSAEGKLQVEVARLNHRKTRLAGRGIGMSQQSGMRGTRGPGETQKEREMQHLDHLMLRLRRQLEQLERVRDTQRKRRIERRIPHVSIIGYTNAGKSTILNLLTRSTVLAENKLFATLDTATRELVVDGVKKGTISDTVGFIQNLPHQLIEAFKSTLADVIYADLLLCIVDISNKNWRHQIRVVNEILKELGAEEKPILFVFNKVDLLDEEALEKVKPLLDDYCPHLLISALSKESARPLFDALKKWERQ